MAHFDPNNVLREILAEAESATGSEARAYLLGASRDGTFNRLHATLRISQADPRWLEVLRLLLMKLGSSSWIYREGSRNVWVIESTYRLHWPLEFSTEERRAYVRSYFDAECGVPRRLDDRFYIQFVQKNQENLSQVWAFLSALGIKCGMIHNPSARVDPDYWRFYVLASSQPPFVSWISSWHPRKRQLIDERARRASWISRLDS